MIAVWVWVLAAAAPGPVSVEASTGVLRFEQAADASVDRVQGFAPWAQVSIEAQPLRRAVAMPWGSWALRGRWLRTLQVEGDGARTQLDRLRIETHLRLGRFGPVLGFERFEQRVDGLQAGLSPKVLSAQAGLQGVWPLHVYDLQVPLSLRVGLPFTAVEDGYRVVSAAGSLEVGLERQLVPGLKAFVQLFVQLHPAAEQATVYTYGLGAGLQLTEPPTPAAQPPPDRPGSTTD